MIEMKKTVYICEICGMEWNDSSDAEACEMSHRVNLDVVDMKFMPGRDDNRYGFPVRIMVDDPTHSGCTAEYALVKEGPVEDFEPYYPQEHYECD